MSRWRPQTTWLLIDITGRTFPQITQVGRERPSGPRGTARVLALTDSPLSEGKVGRMRNTRVSGSSFMGIFSFSFPLPLTGVDILLALPLLALDGCRVQPFGVGVRDLDESAGAVTETVCFCGRIDMIDVNASFVSSGTLDEWLRGAELLNYISTGK